MNLFVLDKSLDVIAVVDTYSSLIWTDRYQAAGDFELCMPMDRTILSYIKQDYYLWRNDSEHVMIIEKIVIETSEEGPKATISGRSLESILDRRVIWGLKNLSGDFQDAVETLLDECIIMPSKPERKIENFIFERSDDTRIVDLTVDTQYTGDNLYDVVCSLCTERGLGFRVTLNDRKQFVFTLYAGDDRSYDQFALPYVVFSPNFDNIIDSNYLESKQALKNVTLVGGEGEGSDRRYTAVGNTAGLDRRELFTDARDISSDDDEDLTESFDFTMYAGQVFNDSTKKFETVTDFNSCMVDVSKYAGRTISITIPKYTPAAGGNPPYATILVNSSKQYISTLQKWEKYEDTASRGVLQTYEIQLPIDARYIYTSMFSQKAIDGDVYYGEVDDFQCQSIKLSSSEYITLLRQRGSENLAENVEIVAFDGQAETSLMFKYGVDFFMGDIVSVADEYGHETKSRVTELITSENEDGSVSTYPTFTTMEYVSPDGGLIPDDYTILDYIESTGTQYVDTGLSLPKGFHAVVDIMLTRSSDSIQCVIGSHEQSAPYYRNYFAVNPNMDSWNIGCDDSANFGVCALNTRYSVDVCNISGLISCSINGIDQGLKNEIASSDRRSSRQLYLLAMNYLDGLLPCFARLYSCTIYDGTNMVRNFFPVRHRTGTVGLYDVVGQAFYGNSGTGVFIGSDEEAPGLLPKGYTQKEYIESSGTQYIDTLFKPNHNTRVTMDVEVLSQTAASNCIFGTRSTSSSTAPLMLNLWSMNTGASVRFDYFGHNQSSSISIVGKRVKIDANKNVCTIDGTSLTVTSGTGQVVLNLYLLTVNNAGGTKDEWHTTAKLYSCKIYDNGILVRDFIPCTNPSGVAGLYDIVGKAFYANSGTGTFITG